MISRASALKLALVSAIFTIGYLLHPRPISADSPISYWEVLGTFFIFAGWIICTSAWGRVLRSLLQLNTVSGFYLNLALGSFGAAVTMMTLGHLGLIGPQFKIMCLALLLSALIFDREPIARPSRPSLTLETAVKIAIAFVVLTIVIYSMQPAVNSSDEFRYHLVGPKLWFDAGHIYMPARAPIVMHCSYWEYLYLWGFSLLSGHGAFGLIEAQFFAQWAHVFLGYVGSLFALYFVLKRFTSTPHREERLWALLGVFAVSTYAPLALVAYTAKNDWGAILWVLSGISLLFRSGEISKSHLFAAGVLLGGGFVAKYPAAFAVVVSLGYWLISSRPKKCEIAYLSGAIVLSMAPILLRNGILIGNPLYPTFNQIFRSPWAGSTWQWYQEQYELKGLETSFRDWARKFYGLYEQWPLSISMIGMISYFTPARRRILNEAAPLCFVAAVSFLFYSLKARAGVRGDTAFFRVGGTMTLLMVACSVLVLQQLLDRLRSESRALIAGGLAAATLFHSFLPFYVWHDIWLAPSPAISIRTMLMGGDAKAWLRNVPKPGDFIVSTGEDQVYYYSHLNFAVIPEQPELDSVISERTDPVAIVRILRDYDARYMFDGKHWDRPYWNQTAYLMGYLFFLHPESIAYAGRDAIVVDLVKLETLVEQACVKPHVRPLGDITGPLPTD